MSALGGGTSLTVAMAFLCIFFGSISLLFFILRLRQKKAEFKDETEKFYRNFGIPLLVPYTKDFERITQF